MRAASIIFTLISLIYSSHIFSQPQSVRFDKTIHDFGDISLNSGSHKHTFVFENISENPVVIQTVVSSCGCAAPVWTKKPVMPGESGTIEVTYLNNQGPYPFDKSLTVYITGEPRPVILRIRGVVHAKPKKLKELFPENFEGLSFRKSYLDLGPSAIGSIVRETIEAANTSASEITLSLKCDQPGIKIDTKPGTIKKGETTSITFTIDTKKADSWGTTNFYPEIFINGKKVTSRQLRITTSIRDNFSSLSKEERNSAPLPMAESSTYDFGTTTEGSIVNASFKIRNLGQRDFSIHKAESGSDKIKINNPGKIPSGEQKTLTLAIDTSGNTGEISYIITLITNSPSRPVMNLVVTGFVQ
jgi:hypothetical protein